MLRYGDIALVKNTGNTENDGARLGNISNFESTIINQLLIMLVLKKAKKILMLSLVCVAGIAIANSCTHEPYALPETKRSVAAGICFERDILPIFQSNCAKSGCHDAGSHEEGYTLNSYANIVRKGIVPGNAAASKIWETVAIAARSSESFMPKDGNPLTAVQLDLIKRWIVAGAVDSGDCSSSGCDTSLFTYSGAVAPIMETYCIGCHSSASAPGGDLTNYAAVRQSAVNGNLIGAISHSTGFSFMPSGGDKLEDCKITQIKKWVAAGGLNN